MPFPNIFFSTRFVSQRNILLLVLSRRRRNSAVMETWVNFLHRIDWSLDLQTPWGFMWLAGLSTLSLPLREQDCSCQIKLRFAEMITVKCSRNYSLKKMNIGQDHPCWEPMSPNWLPASATVGTSDSLVASLSTPIQVVGLYSSLFSVFFFQSSSPSTPGF